MCDLYNLIVKTLKNELFIVNGENINLTVNKYKTKKTFKLLCINLLLSI